MSTAHQTPRTFSALEIHEEIKKLIPGYQNRCMTVYEHLKKLDLRPVGTDPARRNTRLYAPEAVELVKLSIEDTRAGSGGRAYAPRGSRPRLVEAPSPDVTTTAQPAPRPAMQSAVANIPAVPTSGAPTWQEFDATARKLARICKLLRVTLVEIENPTDGEAKIRYEQNNAGEIKL